MSKSGTVTLYSFRWSHFGENLLARQGDILYKDCRVVLTELGYLM